MLLTAIAHFVLASSWLAHGGIYRGPTAITPSSIAALQSTGLQGPAYSVPTAQDPVASRDGGEPSSWQHWWQFHKHAYLGLRKAVREYEPVYQGDGGYFGSPRPRGKLDLAPSDEQIHESVLPALKKLLDSSNQQDTVSSCMIAMAKVGQDHKDFALADVFAKRLKGNSQQLREIAALAMGISAAESETALSNLIALSLAGEDGRERTGGEVRNRTRAFALYGLGLYANQHVNATVQRRALRTMRTVLEDKDLRDRNLKVAAIHGIGLLAFDRSSVAGRGMLDEALDSLHRYYTMPAGDAAQLVQSHCPTAIVKLLGREHPRLEAFRELFVRELEGEDKDRRGIHLVRSAVLALGQLCQACDAKDGVDRSSCELLMQTANHHVDSQTRFFALLALGQIGGTQNQQFLLRVLEADDKHDERPWAAIALGVQAFSIRQAQLQSDEVPQPQARVGEALTRQLEKATRPDLIGALGIALGLTRHTDAAGWMRKHLAANLQREQQAGYLCMGLAMMGDLASIEVLRETMKASSRRPWLLAESATALGLLGDKVLESSLRKVLRNPDTPVATFAAACNALGEVGDKRSVAPLKHALLDEHLTDLQRAFSAASLGGVASRSLLPWHAKISTNINYRAAVETLSDGQDGVLDLL